MSGTGGQGANGSPGYPVLPPGWPATISLIFYGWQQSQSNNRFSAACASLNFSIINGVHLVVEPDPVQAGSEPHLAFVFAHLPPGKTYYFYVSMPLSSLSQSASYYPFATRLMNVQYGSGAINPMLVPILSASNGPLVSAWHVARFNDLENIFAAANAAAPPNTHYILQAIGCGMTSESAFDAEMTIPSDAGNGSNIPAETGQQAIANWNALGVTENTAKTVLCNHIVAMAQGPGVGKFLLNDFLNPGASLIGSINVGNGGFPSYQTNTQAMTDALAGIGRSFTVFDASLTNNPERSIIVDAANYSGSYACQLTGGAPYNAAIAQALSRNALWIEIGGNLIDQLVASGFNGSAFVSRPPPPSVFVTN